MSTRLRMTNDILPAYYEAVPYFIEDDGTLYELRHPGNVEYDSWNKADQAALYNILDGDKLHWGL